LIFKRPGIGIPPYKINNIIGKRVTANIDKDHVFRWSDFC